MIEDAELLRRYANEGSETAFAGLVQRHLNFVYACALRRVGGDAHLAEDVTQHVFTALARRAAALRGRESLAGWLYTTTRNASARVVRSERRRQVREAAFTMNESRPGEARDAEWERLRPVIDDALDGLSGDDREAVLLRFFEGKSYADIGARLRLAENTARMRVERALEKLRSALTRRGVTSTTAGLAVALATQGGVAAPAGMAASVTGAALAGTAVCASGWLAGLIGIGKLQAGMTGVVVLAGAGTYVWQANTNASLRREVAAMQEQRPAIAALRLENQRLAAAAAEVAMLQRDDLEFKELAARAAEIKRASEEKTRVARLHAQNRRQELEAWLREQDRLAQAEVERMNREGNALVDEFKQLSSQAKDAQLAVEVRSRADAAAKVKLEEIQAKQREIKAYIEETRRVLSEHQAELRRMAATDGGPAEPPGAFAAQERYELQLRAREIEARRSARTPNPSADVPAPARGTLILRP